MKKLFFSALTLVALSIGASSQSIAKATPKRTTTVTHTTSKTNPQGTRSVEKTTTASKGTAAPAPRHKKHFVHKKKTTTAGK